MGGECYSCNGTGVFTKKNGETEQCRKCGGTGWYERARPGERVTIRRTGNEIRVSRGPHNYQGETTAIVVGALLMPFLPTLGGTLILGGIGSAVYKSKH